MASVPIPEQAGATMMQGVLEQLRRLVGDPPNSPLPESLRSKGIIEEMRDEFRREMRSQRAATLLAERRQSQRDKLVDDKFEHAQQQRHAMRNQMQTLSDDVAELKMGQHRIRRTFLIGLRWATKKDDGLTTMVVKLGAICTALGVIGVAVYHIGVFFVHTVQIGLSHIH